MSPGLVRERDKTSKAGRAASAARGPAACAPPASFSPTTTRRTPPPPFSSQRYLAPARRKPDASPPSPPRPSSPSLPLDSTSAGETASPSAAADGAEGAKGAPTRAAGSASRPCSRLACLRAAARAPWRRPQGVQSNVIYVCFGGG